MKIKKAMAFVLGFVMILSQIPSNAENAEVKKDDDIILHYDFDNEITQGVNYGAVIKDGYAYFDGQGSYIHMPDNLVSGEENVTFLLNVRPEMDGANQFTFTIGTSDRNYLFFNTNNGENARFAMTNVGWWSEQADMKADAIEKGEWASVAVVMNGKSKKLYVNGSVAMETTSEMLASGLGDTNQNYLAKSQYATDSYFNGYIEDFRIIRGALSSDEIALIAKEHEKGASKTNVFIASERLNFENYNLTENVALPTSIEGINVSWESSNPEVLSNEGIIKRLDTDAWVEMTATFSDKYDNSTKRVYNFMVIHEYTDKEIVLMDMNAIHLAGNLKYLREDLYLPTESTYGSTITWVSENTDVITHDGKITRLPVGEGSRATKLYLICTYNETSVTREYEINVLEEDFAYLFAYFTGNSSHQEKVYYGLSRDGYHFNAINNGNPVLESTKGHKGVRDPFIMQGQNGNYYMLLTDMRSSEGWRSQSSIIIFESEDLVNWDDGTIIDFNQFGNFTTAWAPQAIWDPEFYDAQTGEYGAYMIYLALCPAGNPQMYKVYTKDMKTLITEPEIFYKRADDKADIDSDIIYKDGMYYMYVKDESNGGIYVVTSPHAGGPYSERINALPAQGAPGGIEGSAIYKVMNEDKYNLVYDAYNNGFFIMSQTEDLVNFTQLHRSEYSFNFTPRHGYVIHISKEQVDRLQEVYGRSIAERVEAKRNPILYYNFENNKDKSGNFHDAQFAPSARIAQGISGGRGLLLDGTSESFVTIPCEVTEGLYDYTISAWVKPDTDTVTQRVFDFGTGTQRYMFLTPYYGAGLVRGAVTAGSHSYEKGISVERIIETNRWTHFVMMQQGDTMRLYIDGELVGEQDGIRLDPYEIQYVIPYCYIGKSMWQDDKYFDGTIDEFRLYNRGLSEEEVKELYNAEIPVAINFAETEGQFVVEIAKDGAAIDQFDAIICQYNSEGIMVSAVLEKIDFTLQQDDVTSDLAEDVITTTVEKTGDNIRVFMFRDFKNLIPLK